jgi:hypothetical protein
VAETVSTSGVSESPLQTLRRHRVPAVIIVIACTAASLGIATTRPSTYSAEARLAVDGAKLSSQAVPGFALASQELAANYARYVNNAGTQTDLESAIDAPKGSVEDVAASPIPQSNVVRIEVAAGDPDVAVAAAAAVSDRLLKQVNESTVSEEAASAALEEFTAVSQQVASAEQAAAAAQNAVDRAVAGEVGDVGVLRQAAANSGAELAILEIQQQALGEQYRALVAENHGTASQLTVVQAATSTGDDLLNRLQQFGLAGLVAGALLALLGASLLERRRRAAADRGDAETAPDGRPATSPTSRSLVDAGDAAR